MSERVKIDLNAPAMPPGEPLVQIVACRVEVVEQRSGRLHSDRTWKGVLVRLPGRSLFVGADDLLLMAAFVPFRRIRAELQRVLGTAEPCPDCGHEARHDEVLGCDFPMCTCRRSA